MQLLTYTSPRLLLASKGKHIREINDVYIAPVLDEAGNIIEEEHKPLYSTVIFPGAQIETLAQAKKLYIEEDIIEGTTQND